MSIHEIVKTENVGLVKEIDENSIDLIFQSVQETIYSFPERSFIREIFSNGYDSVKEKLIAFKILKDGEPVENYYLNRKEAVVKDSNFIPSYYDFNFLESVETPVTITYEEREDKLKDLIAIEDYGVGLSNTRFQNSTKLGWSNKRNTAYAIGKFGQGNKSGLATGADFYTMTSFYNGFTATLMIYKDYFHSINEETEGSKVINWKGKTKDGQELLIPVIWNPTYRKNGAIVTMEVPKYTKDKYYRAVREQLPYFKESIEFYLKKEGVKNQVDLSTNFLFESDTCIIPETSNFNEPHIVINKVVYNKVEWAEIGLEKRYGKIALKVEGLDMPVNNSREMIIWNEKARKILLKVIDTVTKEAEEYIQGQITLADNFFVWLKTVSNVNLSSNNPVLYQLGKFIPKANLNLKWDLSKLYNSLPKSKHPEVAIKQIYRDDPSFNWLFNLFNLTYVTIGSEYSDTLKKSVPKLTQEPIKDFHKFNYCQDIYYAKEASLSLNLVSYLFEKKGIQSIIYIREKTDKQKEFKSLSGTNNITLSILEKYASCLDVLVIPEEYLQAKEKIKKEEIKKVQEKELETKLKSKERKKNILTVKETFVFRETDDNYEIYIGKYSWNRENKIKRNSYRNYTEETLRTKYGCFIYAETKNSLLLDVVCQMLYNSAVVKDMSNILMGTVSKETMKKLGKFKDDFAINVTDLIMEKTENGFKLHELFIQHNTARIVADLMVDNPYLRKIKLLENINEDFKTLSNSWDKYSNVAFNAHTGVPALLFSNTDVVKHDREEVIETFDALDNYLKNVEVLHKLIYENKLEEVKTKSKELFGSDTPLTISAIDAEFVSTLNHLVKVLSPVKPILNNLNYDTIEKEGLGDSISDILSKLL